MTVGSGVLALALTWGASVGLGQRAVDERRPASVDGTVKITDVAGSIRVVGWTRDTVAITGALGAEVEELEFTTDERSTRIRLILRPEYRTRPVGGSDLEVRVPRQSHVAVRTAEGGIEIVGIQGAVDLESGTGDIRVGGSPRFIYARSVGGTVDVEGFSKLVRASSVAGDVIVRRAGGYVDVSTVSGDIDLVGRTIWEGRATSVSGNVSFEGDFDDGGSFSFESNSGAIELVVPPRLRADFSVTTFAGTIQNDLAPGSGSAGSASSGAVREVSFSVGGGGARIDVKTYKGAIRLLEGR
jgi:hypothetical protein